jgi:hypothetical protein
MWAFAAARSVLPLDPVMATAHQRVGPFASDVPHDHADPSSHRPSALGLRPRQRAPTRESSIPTSCQNLRRGDAACGGAWNLAAMSVMHDQGILSPPSSRPVPLLTWGFQPEPARLAESRKVAGRAACAVPVDSSASRPVTGCVSAFLTHKAREWHALTLSSRRGTWDVSPHEPSVCTECPGTCNEGVLGRRSWTR